MTSTPRTTRSLAALTAVALALTACGDDGGSDGDADPGATTTDAGGGATTTEPGGDGGDAADVPACDLLDPATLADLVTFEFGGGDWAEADDPAPGTCSWTNDEQQTTLSVEVLDGIDAVLGGLSAGSGTELEDVPVGAGTATGVRDTAADRLISLYVPAGADSVVKLTQSPLKLDDDAMVAVGEAAAIAFENLPVDGGDDDGDDETGAGEPSGDLAAVRFTVQSSDAGIDLDFEVTVDDVLAAGNPVTTGIICAGVEEGDAGIFTGTYAVDAHDLDRPSGLVLVQVESFDVVDGPGSYEGQLTAQDSDGRSVEVEGTLAIDEGMRTGELVGADDAGNQVVATWECTAS